MTAALSTIGWHVRSQRPPTNAPRGRRSPSASRPATRRAPSPASSPPHSPPSTSPPAPEPTCAIRRAALNGIELADGYAVELALLVDLYARFGAEAIVEVDLGERIHRNRPLRELTSQARDIIAAALVRAEVTRQP